MKVLSSGELPRVMRASMSLPSILAPTEIDENAYIDGGLVRNLPVDVGRELCGEVLIAVNLGTKPKTKDQVRNSLDVALQSIVILTDQNVQRSLQELTSDDVLIEPELDDFTSSSFASQRAIIERGLLAARANEKQLSKLSLTPDEYRRWQRERTSKIPVPLEITNITTEVTGSVDKKAVLRDVATHPGKGFDIKKLDKEITRIYGRGDFSYVGYSIVPDERNATVVIKADSKPWGPGYLKFGLGAATDFSSPTQLNLAASYRRTWINTLGAEWRTDAQIGYDSFLRTEFIQPLQTRDGVFVNPYILARRNFVQLYQDDVRLGDFKVERYQAGLDGGITGKTGEIRFGGFANSVTSKPGLGAINPLFNNTEVTQKGLIIKGVIDQLDSYVFPGSGLYAIADIRSVKQDGDTLEEYTRAQLGLTGAWSFANNTVAGRLEWGDELSGADNFPVFEVFKLGGPNRLSGLFLDQLSGTHYELATLNFYHRYASLPPQIGRGLYVGVSLEGGRINDPLMQDPWDRIYSGSVYWGADTILGATYIGYGRSSLDQSSFYLMIGPHF
jgi:NTE family protein